MESALQQMAGAVETLTASIQKISIEQEKQSTDQQQLEERLTAQMKAMDTRLEANEYRLATHSVLPQQMAQESATWQVDGTDMPSGWEARPLTGAETATLIQKVLEDKVKPAMQQAYSNLDSRVSQTEQELSQLRTRVSWVEKDMLYQQIQQAKHTVICRNWPLKYTLEDRHLTVEKAMRAAGVTHNLVDCFTGQYSGADGNDQLSAITILTFVHFTERQKFLSFHKGKDFTAITGFVWLTEKTKDPSTGEEKDTWSTEETKDRIKITPGITQIERRLEAPLFGLMNSLSTVLLKYKGKSFKPYWKSLVIEGPEGEWLGQVRYERVRASQSLQATSHTDFECKVYIPEELYSQVLESWANTWYDQLKKQFQQTEDEDKAIAQSSQQTAENYSKVVRFTKLVNRSKPDWSTGKEQNVDNWVARFKWEFPWKITFHSVGKEDPMRSSFTELQNVEDLMKEMDEAGQSMEVDLKEGETLRSMVTPPQMQSPQADPNSQPPDSSNASSSVPTANLPSTGKGVANKRASPEREEASGKHQKK